MRSRFRSIITVVVALLLPSALAGQDVFGVLRLDTASAPATGTMVEATHLRDGRFVARTMVGATGTWRLRLSTDRVVLRALRIGFAPHVLDTLEVAVGETRELNAVLSGTPVVLPALRTAADSRCRVRPDSASLVATVFHQARTAVAASMLVPADGPLLARVRLTEATWTADESRVVESQQRDYATDSLRPFGSASVDSLLEFGFVTRRQERVPGSNRGVDVAVEYRVPSLALFVDERFLERYRLFFTEPPREHPEWIGVGFRPARRERTTQIEGTLWIDRASAELRRLEFGYAGVDDSHAQVDPGGWLEFTRLQTGHWFVPRWALRLPALGQWVERSARATELVTLRNVPVVRIDGVVVEVTLGSRVVCAPAREEGSPCRRSDSP
ncbi:MAG: carboxypeptidase regulatory-like domain-containing protein [Gemmatimonadaceae bacterium]|nr:carboxypeptidase regulatory-like domain-containing protein [Gemmatimonadaceae bacterium]